MNEALIIGAVMKALGVTEVFLGNELLEAIDGKLVIQQVEDFMRDGWTIRLHEGRPDVIRAEVITPGEIES